MDFIIEHAISGSNFIVLLIVLFKLGSYKSKMEDRLSAVEENIAKIQEDYHEHINYDNDSDGKIASTQIKHGESLARLEVIAASTNNEVTVLRDRFNKFLDHRS